MKFDMALVRDLTAPRYAEKMFSHGKCIVDLHGMPDMPIMRFEHAEDISKRIEAMNILYHNQIIKNLFGMNMLKLAANLKRINRDSW